MRRQVIIILLTFLVIPFFVGLSFAQSVPQDLEIKCNTADEDSDEATCFLQVPAETIGSEFQITIPDDNISAIKNLEKGEGVPLSSLFLRLSVTEEINQYLIEVDFADIQATSFSTDPYFLIKFDLVLEEPQLPLALTAVVKQGSKLFDSDSLADNEPLFEANVDSLMIFAVPGEGAEDVDDVEDEDGGGTFKYAPELYCFDDNFSSMTDEEWLVVCDAKNRGIISGNPTDTGTFFFPNQPINRAEVVKILTLGILRSLDKLTDGDFTREQNSIASDFGDRDYISFPDIEYKDDGTPPWFAVYVNLASDNGIVSGYPDGTFKAINKINNAETYKVIVETARAASSKVADSLIDIAVDTRRLDWFIKYTRILDEYNISYSEDYGAITSRKDFLILVMNLLKEVGL